MKFSISAIISLLLVFGVLSEDVERQVERVALGGTLRKTIETFGKDVDNCYITDPTGKVYELYPSNEYEDPSVELVKASSLTFCAVDFKPIAEEHHGMWSLIARNQNGDNEIAQHFSMEVEASLGTIPSGHVTISEGQNLHIRLADSSHDLKDCHLLIPENVDEAEVSYSADFRYSESCGFIVNNIQRNDSGTWRIEGRGNIIAVGSLEVEVVVSDQEIINEDLTFSLGKSVTLKLGPEDAFYCQAETPTGEIKYDNLGQCTIEIDAISEEHQGIWKAQVGIPNKFAAVLYNYNIFVDKSAPVNTLTSAVSSSELGDHVNLECHLRSERDLKLCKFTRPDGVIFFANVGTGDEDYSFYGSGTSTDLETGVVTTSCGVTIWTVQPRDIGIWNCHLETEENAFSSMLRVADAEPNDSSIVTVPAIEDTEVGINGTSTDVEINTVIGLPLSLTCQASEPLTYCWFRSPNGSSFSFIGREESNQEGTGDFWYSGSGMSNGDCAMTIREVTMDHNGTWNCYLANNDGLQDKIENITVHVYASRLVPISEVLRPWNSSTIHLMASSLGGEKFEYCRFVGPDGRSYNNRAPNDASDLNRGVCGRVIPTVTSSDIGVWTIAALVINEDREISTTITVRAISSINTSFYVALVFLRITIYMCILLCVLLLVWNGNVFKRATSLRRRISERISRNSTLSLSPPPSYEDTIATNNQTSSTNDTLPTQTENRRNGFMQNRALV